MSDTDPSHSLLKRQLRRHFSSVDSPQRSWTDFLASVDQAYREFDADRAMLERSLELSSQELLQANSQMRAIIDAFPDLFFRVNAEGLVLDCQAGKDMDAAWSPKELVGTRIHDSALFAHSRSFIDSLRAVRETNAIVSIECSAVLRGQERFYEARLLPLGPDQIFVVVRNITTRKQAEAALRENQRSLSTLISNLPGVVFRYANDREWTMEYVSERVLDLTGYTPEDFLQQRVIPTTLIHPEDRERVWRMMQDAVAKKQPFEMTYRILTAASDERWVWAQGCGVFDEHAHLLALEGYVADITLRKRAEEALQETKESYHHLIDNAHDMIQSVGPDGRFLFVNRVWVETMGYQVDEVISMSVCDIAHPDSVVHCQKLFQEVAAGVSPRLIKTEFVARNGRSVLVEGTVTGRYADGRVVAIDAFLRNVTEQREWQERLDFVTHHDQLTNLPNRVVFMDRLAQALLRLKHPKATRPVAVLLLDLDRFKLINDSLGHVAGDQLLVMVANRLTRCVREGDTVARIGGDEFAILLLDIAKTNDVILIADKLFATFHETFQINAHELFVTASIGISLAPYDGDEAGTLLKNADTAMYRAKDQGRNNYQLYSPAMNVSTLERLSMERSLHHALERREFLVYYQPQIDLKTGQIVGMESLVRWQHPDLGVVSPAKFIPLAEETGLIIAISTLVMRAACTQNRLWQEAGVTPFPMAVNLSARQFQQTDLMATTVEVLRECRLDPMWLELELTESLLMENVDQTIATLRDLRRLGVRFALDDFGTGYSSLSYLKRFPITTVKIDQSFVRSLTQDEDDAAITKAIIAMAHSLKLTVVAEGVEQEHQSEFLKREGCDTIQGYLISRPLPADQMTKLLLANTWFSKRGPMSRSERSRAA
ncbi:MAG: sensor domain-containing protein [Nitrospirota bacterium]